MATNKAKPKRADDPVEPKGGLEGGTVSEPRGPLINVGGVSGGTNSLSPVGGVHVGNANEYGSGPHTGNQGGDIEQEFDGSRKPSPSVTKQEARDAAHVDTTAGLPAAPGNPKQHNETDPTGRSHSDGASVTKGSLRQKKD